MVTNLTNIYWEPVQKERPFYKRICMCYSQSQPYLLRLHQTPDAAALWGVWQQDAVIPSFDCVIHSQSPESAMCLWC